MEGLSLAARCGSEVSEGNAARYVFSAPVPEGATGLPPSAQVSMTVGRVDGWCVPRYTRTVADPHVTNTKQDQTYV